MIGLAVLLLRLGAGILKLTIRLLGLAVRWGLAAMRRRPPAIRGGADKEPAPRRDSSVPSRRRAFTAPPRARRTIS